MTIPQMTPANTDRKLALRVEKLEAVVKELTAAPGTLGASTISKGGLTITDPDTGARVYLGQGNIAFWDNYDTNPSRYGRFFTDPGVGINLLRMFPPYSDGSGLENSITVQGRRAGLPGNFWVYTDGILSLSAKQRVSIDGDTGIDLITGGALKIYELPTTGSAANLRLDPGTATVLYVTSSRRYKTDIIDATIDPADVLKLRPRMWRDKGEKAREGEQTRMNLGFIAEEVDELPTMRPVVDYDAQGRPDALQYERIVAGTVVVAQDHEKRLKTVETSENSTATAMAAALDRQAKAIADLTTALARTPGHGTASTPVLALAATVDVTVPLDKTMPDTAYTAVVQLVGSAAAGTATVKSKTTTAVTLTLKATVALGAGAVLVTARY